MSLKDQLLTAAEAALAEQPAGVTVEALARLLGTQLRRLIPPRQVGDALRGWPERFTEGGDGRWRLRRAPGALTGEDGPDTPAETAPARPALRPGCYVVFDLETTVS